MGPCSCIHLHCCMGVSTAYHESGHHNFWAQVFQSFGWLSSFHVRNIESFFILFFKFVFMHCYGESLWVMTDLSANLAEKMQFFGYRRN